MAKVWEENFRDALFIRPKTQHSKCSECIRHKLVLKRLKRNISARRAQLTLYRNHLKRQYNDRVHYWKNRSESRVGDLPNGIRKITCIIDSIDQATFPLPKSLSMSSKDFAGYIRPCLGVTAQIIHGFAMVVYVSCPHVRHDSSWTADLLCHGMNILKEEFDTDLRQVHYACHADNSSKELKNNCCFEILSGLVSLHRLNLCNFFAERPFSR